MRQHLKLTIVLTVLTVCAGGVPSAQSSCSLIPPADEYFLADNNGSLVGGLIDSPLSAPGRAIRVAVDPCETPTPPLFTQPASSNSASIRVIRPNGTLSAPVIATGSRVESCTGAASTCRVLTFTVPAGVAAAGAGPAEIEVRNGNGNVVVQVGDLFRITKPGCPTDEFGNRAGRITEDTFSHFTILPTPNKVADLVSGAVGTVRATVDVVGNLLIPLDFAGVLRDDPGTPIATFLSGSAPIPASSGSDSSSIPEKLAAIANSSHVVRSFTLKGRPLPPLLVLAKGVATPQIFGTIDAVESVLRIARFPNGGSTPLFNLDDRRPASGAPLEFPYDSIAVGESAHLDWLRKDGDLIAYAVEEWGAGAGGGGLDLNLDGDKADRVGFIKNTAEVGGPLWGRSTWLGVAKVPFGQREVIGMSVADGYVALLQDDGLDGGRFRLFDGMANRRDDLDWDRSVELQEMVAGQPLKQEGALSVFFQKPLPTPHQRQAADPSRPIDVNNFRAVGLKVSPDGRHLYAGPFGTDGQISIYSIAASGAPSANPVAFAQAGTDDELPGMVFSDDGLSLYVTGTSTDKVYAFSRIASTGELVPVAGGAVTVDSPGRIALHGNDVYVTSFESHSLTHFKRNPADGKLSLVSTTTDGTRLKGAYGIGISPDGRSVYVGASRGFRISVYSRDASSGNLVYLERVRHTTNGVSGLSEPRDVKVSADGTTVYAASPIDDGLTAFRRDVVSGGLTFIGDFLEDSEVGTYGPFGVGVSPDGHHVLAATTSLAGGDETSLMVFERHPGVGSLVLRRKVLQSEVGGQRGGWSVDFAPNGRFGYVATFDGILTVDLRRELSVVDADTGGLVFDPPPRGVYADIAGTKALLVQTEIDAALDNNGDGDRCDRRFRVIDTVTKASKGYALAIAEAVIGEDILAFTIDEGATNRVDDPVSSCTTGRPGTDLNGDEDDQDRILAVSSSGTSGAYTSLGVDASDLAIVPSGVVFLSGETAVRRYIPGPVCPAGTTTGEAPRYVHYYRGGAAGDGELVDLGYDAVDFVAGDTVLAMRVSEAAHGRVLNNDGDCEDAVMVLLELPVDGAHSVVARSSGRSARRCDVAGCLPGVPYRLEDRTVSFLIHEQDEVGGDSNLEGDADRIDVVAARFSLDDQGSCLAGPENGFVIDADDDGYDDFMTDLAPPAGCGPVPLTGCHGANPAKASTLAIRSGDEPSDGKMKWKWTSVPGTGLAPFGDPLVRSANYSVCLYDAGQLRSASVFASAGNCDGRPCWRSKPGKSFQLARTSGFPAGVDSVRFRSVGSAGVVGFSLAASGENLELPSLPLGGPVIVQLVRHDACGLSACWDAPMNRMIKNLANDFRGSSASD